jgi:malonyl-CoA O-methyltransferase
MSSQFWKHPRSNSALASQWLRRVHGSLPFILEEVNTRMVNRAQIMRPVEGGVVHQGCLHPEVLLQIKGLFLGRELKVFAPREIGLPLLPTDSAVASFLSKLWPGRTVASKTALAIELSASACLPLANESQAMVWSPLWLHSVEDPGQQMAEWFRVLKPEGGVFFSCFGPDTAQELQLVAQALGEHLPDFADMHDLGDLMSKQGFSDPVMEMEKLTLTYSEPRKLLQDWRMLAGNSLLNRKKGCRTPRQLDFAMSNLEQLRAPDTGRISLTLELVYGHAWKVKRQKKIDITTVNVSEIKGRKTLK